MKRRVTQAEFDNAVKDFMEGLELEGSEAIDMAVEEFEMQGCDLTGLERNLPQDRTAHPLAEAFTTIRDCISAQEVSSEACISALKKVQELCTVTDVDERTRALTVRSLSIPPESLSFFNLLLSLSLSFWLVAALNPIVWSWSCRQPTKSSACNICFPSSRPPPTGVRRPRP